MPIQDFITVMSPAIVLSILLGAVGEAIVARIVVEYMLSVLRNVSIFPVPSWAIETVRFLGLLGVIAMSWRVIPPPRGVPKSIYAVAASAMYVAFWLIQPLNIAVNNVGMYMHGIATELALFLMGKAAFASMLVGLLMSTIQTLIATFTAQVLPIATVIFLACIATCYVLLYYFMTGIVTGLVNKTAMFLKSYLQHHPAWYLLLLMIVTDTVTGILMSITIVTLTLILATGVAMIIAVVVGKLPWSFLSSIASGLVGVIVSIFLSTFMKTAIDNAGKWIEDMFGIRPPFSVTIFGVLLAVASIIALTVMAPLLYIVTGLYTVTTALTLLGVLGGGIPKRPRQLRTLTATLVTMFMMAALLGPLLPPIRAVTTTVIHVLKHFGVIS